jgi:hypothetical protein
MVMSCLATPRLQSFISDPNRPRKDRMRSQLLQRDPASAHTENLLRCIKASQPRLVSVAHPEFTTMQFNRNLFATLVLALVLLSAPALASPRHGGDDDGGADRDGDRVCVAYRREPLCR